MPNPIERLDLFGKIFASNGGAGSGQDRQITAADLKRGIMHALPVQRRSRSRPSVENSAATLSSEDVSHLGKTSMVTSNIIMGENRSATLYFVRVL